MDRARRERGEGCRVSALPPGPRMPRALQAVGWTQRPLPFLEQCQRRYGDTFTLRILHWGDWVLLCDPDDVKRVFTAGDAVGVDVANPLLGPVLGPRSVMLLEEPEHMTRRKLMLPAFHGKASKADAEMMAEVARREVARLAGRRAVRALAADAGDHPGGGDAGGLRRPTEARLERAARAACAADRVDERAAQPDHAGRPSARAGSSAAAATARRWRRSRRR